jgi:hypothetical protein
MFDQSAKLAISQVARGLGVEPAALLAVAEIESGGKPFAHVNGKAMPLIRWEGHYFFRLLPHGLRQQGLLAHLAHPSAGGVPNPASQQARYDMLERARSIHDEAALSSCSWGLGQVMGAHWRRLGFSSVQQLVDTACSGVGGQTELMARFIRAEGLVGVLKQHNWAAFARAYNGPAYKANRYDVLMGRAYIRYLNGRPPPGARAPVLTDYAPSTVGHLPGRHDAFSLGPGASGPGVRELQDSLRRSGHFLYRDGHYGTATQDAVKAFQRKYGLPETGHVGETTRAHLVKLQTEATQPWWSRRPGNPHAIQQATPLERGRKPWWDV